MSQALVPCLYCNDCLPCPVGIPIPEVFKIYNEMEETGREVALAAYQKLPKNAGDCTRCARCEKLCGNKVVVSTYMFEIDEEMMY